MTLQNKMIGRKSCKLEETKCVYELSLFTVHQLTNVDEQGELRLVNRAFASDPKPDSGCGEITYHRSMSLELSSQVEWPD